MIPRSISVIVTTYNWPHALALVLQGLCQQRVNIPVEIIVADDGSTDMTAQCVTTMKADCPWPLHHVWQPDEGFQAAKIRNRAIAKASHDYIIFLDGDCVPPAGFLQRHCTHAEAGWMVFGNRILFNKAFTAMQIQHADCLAMKPMQWAKARYQGYVNRLNPWLPLPLGPLRKSRPLRWRGVKTCNLAVWRHDLIAINGFEEAYQGWGYEDSDLVIRLHKAGVKTKDGRFSLPVMHLWHPEQDRNALSSNQARFLKKQAQGTFFAEKGLSQYFASAKPIQSDYQQTA